MRNFLASGALAAQQSCVAPNRGSIPKITQESCAPGCESFSIAVNERSLTCESLSIAVSERSLIRSPANDYHSHSHAAPQHGTKRQRNIIAFAGASSVQKPCGLCGFTLSVLPCNYAQESFVSVTQEYITIVAILRQRQWAWNCTPCANIPWACLLGRDLGSILESTLGA